jgi:hypothetical protein
MTCLFFFVKIKRSLGFRDSWEHHFPNSLFDVRFGLAFVEKIRREVGLEKPGAFAESTHVF